jgi:hypothetical protein
VNTMQQVGGSVGTALLSTIAAGAATSYAGSHTGQGRALAVNAAVHGYTVGFRVSGTIFLVGAIVVFSLIRPHVSPNTPAADSAESTPNSPSAATSSQDAIDSPATQPIS